MDKGKGGRERGRGVNQGLENKCIIYLSLYYIFSHKFPLSKWIISFISTHLDFQNAIHTKEENKKKANPV